MKLEKKLQQLRAAIEENPHDKSLRIQLKQTETMLQREQSLNSNAQSEVNSEESSVDSIEELLIEKEKIENYIKKHPDADELKNELKNVDAKIQKIRHDEIRKYHSELLEQDFDWNIDKRMISFEDGTEYSIDEVTEIPSDILVKMHRLKNEFGFRKLDIPFTPPPKEVNYVVL